MTTYGRCLRALSMLSLLAAAPLAGQDVWRDPSPHRVGRVQVNGVGLHYLDWGGTGPALIFLHGVGSARRFERSVSSSQAAGSLRRSSATSRIRRGDGR